MKRISKEAAQRLQVGWQQLRQESIISSFEVFSEDDGEFNRITARDFGQISKEFLDQLMSLDLESSSDGLCLCLGVEDDKVQVIWEMRINGEKTYYQGDGDHCLTYSTPNTTPTIPSLGESDNYKNEVCANWAHIPYFEMNAIFFVNIQDKDKRSDLFLGRPRRVLKFVIPVDDILVMREVCTAGKSLLVHYGVNYGDAARQMIPFVPLVQIYTPNKNGFLQDDPEATYLDFVGPCPPNCPD